MKYWKQVLSIQRIKISLSLPREAKIIILVLIIPYTNSYSYEDIPIFNVLGNMSGHQ